ncbi:MAG: NAD(P)-dependent oxidoreductase [Chloroflexaceae bacterium]|nr:NAD(P)-dependent oxidoreductase [Chloroflexaceae bacterium]
MRILITGGAGFLGLHLAGQLARQGHQLVLLDIQDFVEDEYPEGVRCYRGDVRDVRLLYQLMEGVDAIVHAAAALPLWKAEEILSVNIDGTRMVMEAARQRGVARVVFISSTAVYGVPEKHPIEETDPLVGVGPYGISKITAERICERYREMGQQVTIIRPKTFVGTARLGVFQILFDWVRHGKRIPIIGSGRNRYQLLEVQDLVSAVALALTEPTEAANDTFNVGATHFQTVREDVQALCDFAGSGARVLSTPAGPIKAALRLFEAMKVSPLYPWVYATADKDSFVSVEKIQHALGWQPQFSNAEALIHSYRWYLDHYQEIEGVSGVTHRVAWDQGILGVFRRVL